MHGSQEQLSFVEWWGCDILCGLFYNNSVFTAAVRSEDNCFSLLLVKEWQHREFNSC